jgi:alkylation response protein AidB-like acyl-CoA dehydrogenase
MPEYKAPIRDYQFILREFLDIEQYTDVPGFEDLSIVDPILEEGARFCEEVLLPLNQKGDEQGLRFNDGEVKLPDGFVEAYHTYVQSGWPSFTAEAEYGGQNLPEVLNMPLTEMICSTNLSFGLLPGLSHGAVGALQHHASDALKQKYLPKMIEGTWTGVMCLTEPQAGTDLGLLRTKAEPAEGDSYTITGTKIFISEGEHDAAENIIHLVLARLPGAPEGVKGISLFLVPKVMVNEDGSLGARNGVKCGSIEHKMGIHASPTCVMNYDGAVGWLVGEPHKGLRAMFTMMNEARIYVGVQGLGVAEAAFQGAYAYAKERLQGRALKGAEQPDKPADSILVHPDVRRMLLTMRAITEGCRTLTLWTALKVDLSKRHPDEKERQTADEFVQLVTPVVKAFLTDMGTEVASTGMQVLGGYGYIREYGMEQLMRDARITQIYEGTNGVQALDLVGRKMSAHNGRYLRHVFHLISEFIDENRESEDMAEFTKPLYKALGSLQQGSVWIAQKGLSNKDEAAGASVEYLRMFALVILGYIWARTAKIALEKKDGEEKLFYETKLATAKFYMHKVLPQHYSLLASLTAGVKYYDMPDKNA